MLKIIVCQNTQNLLGFVGLHLPCAVDLALDIALVCGKDLRQWHVPKCKGQFGAQSF